MSDNIFFESNMLHARMNFDHDQKLDHDWNQKNSRVRDQRKMSSDQKFWKQNEHVTAAVLFRQIRNESVRHDHNNLFSETHRQQSDNWKESVTHYDQITFRQDIRKNKNHQQFFENNEKAHDEDDYLTSSVLSNLKILFKSLQNSLNDDILQIWQDKLSEAQLMKTDSTARDDQQDNEDHHDTKTLFYD